MKLFIGLDDTDILTSRGTGHLAREIAAVLQGAGHTLLGVTRHQLLRDPRVPCTKKNSCAAIHLAVEDTVGLGQILTQVQQRWASTACAPACAPKTSCSSRSRARTSAAVKCASRDAVAASLVRRMKCARRASSGYAWKAPGVGITSGSNSRQSRK